MQIYKRGNLWCGIVIRDYTSRLRWSESRELDDGGSLYKGWVVWLYAPVIWIIKIDTTSSSTLQQTTIGSVNAVACPVT